MTQSKKYKEIYERCLSEGFKVADTENFYENDNYKEKRARSIVDTPYTVNGMPVKGYVIVDADLEHRSPVWQTNVVLSSVIYVEERPNYLKPAGELGLSDAFAVNENDGTTISLEELRGKTATTASAGTCYAHVAMYDEYMASAYVSAGLMGRPKPTDEAYSGYLDAIKTDLPCHPDKYIGRIQRVEDLHLAYASWPAYRESYEKKNHRVIKYPDGIDERWCSGKDEDFEM